jgi:hypothetical protein
MSRVEVDDGTSYHTSADDGTSYHTSADDVCIACLKYVCVYIHTYIYMHVCTADVFLFVTWRDICANSTPPSVSPKAAFIHAHIHKIRTYILQTRNADSPVSPTAP